MQYPDPKPELSATAVGALDTKDLAFLDHLPDVAAAATTATTTAVAGAFRHHGGDPMTTAEADWMHLASSLALSPRGPGGDGISGNASGVVDGMALASAVPGRRPNWTRRLVVTKQPASEFYKDEGGKSNALDVEITLVEFDEHGEPARTPDEEFIDIPLRILLFFESGKRVDDTDQEIFRFVGNEYDSVVIRAATRRALVQFRLEKCTANVADLTPIFTNAICVLSKRKHHTQAADSASRAVKEPPIKLLKRDLTKIEEKLDARLGVILEEVGRLNRQVQLQNELIARALLQPVEHASGSENHQPNLDSATMEWCLKGGLVDDSIFRTVLLPPMGCVGPCIDISDDSEERTLKSSPSSSESSVVEIPSSSLTTISFAEF